ncbi:MAG: DMT family transporter [Acidimicrobiales bacterium]|nr:DMT family transporter [Acidimicrobiales bacterium]
MKRRQSGWSPNTLACIYMTVGTLGYVVNDGLIRVATEDGLDVYQALFLRSIALTAVFAFFSTRRREFSGVDFRQRPLVVRVGAELVGAALFFAALVNIEFANAQTILMLVPFAVTAAAALFLGERVSRAQYVVVVLGFVGVLVVVRPATDAFSWWSVMVVGGAAALVVREFATRQVSEAIPAGAIATITAAALAALTGVLSIFTGWGDVTADALFVLALATSFLFVGYLGTIQTVRVGDLSVSSPFRYTAVLGAVVVGQLFFDETPDIITGIGCLVIVISGVAAIQLERRAEVGR